MIRRSGSKSTLFLMEQIIALFIFAVCVTACVTIFVEAHLLTEETYDMDHALIAAKNGAECFKAAGGDLERTAGLLNGNYVSPDAAVYFDASWKTCRADEAVYILFLRSQGGEEGRYPAMCGLSVEKAEGGGIVAFTVAAGRVSDE